MARDKISYQIGVLTASIQCPFAAHVYSILYLAAGYDALAAVSHIFKER